MKISKLNIKEFRHLKDLEFDFTYPKDYKDKSKAGKPLDKICFIGQSATGKTGLLELIYSLGMNSLKLEVIGQDSIIGFKGLNYINGLIEFSFNDKFYTLNKGAITYNNRKFNGSTSGGVVESLIPTNLKKNIIYFQADLISRKNIELFAKNPIDLIESLNSDENKFDVLHEKEEKHTYLFDDDVDTSTWKFLLEEILNYRKKFTQKMSELIHKGLIADQNKLNNEFSKWQKDNPNALKAFAEKFNPLLKKLNVEVDLVNTEYAIPLNNKHTGEIIPIQSASTGTKGLLLSFLPLFKLDTKDGIVLIDEPERSLYPDMQMDLMEHYYNLARDAQMIVATHSPFVAASFEPEERFILYFDDTGNVKIKKGTSPIGDDPNDLLKNDFKINYYNKYGKKAYESYVELKEKVLNETDSEKKKSLMLEMVKLGNTYNF